MKPIAVVKPLVFVAACLPAAALAYGFYAVFSGADVNALTPNPGDYITDQTGTWTLATLVASLTITPIRRLTHWNDAIKLRRMLGLFAFFYATLHLLTWIVFIHYFDLGEMVKDVLERRFITVGMIAFTILFLLAITSNTFSIRRLGRRWQSLHRWVYVAVVAGVVHYWWLVKADITVPLRWAVAVALLLGFRLFWSVRKRVPTRA